MKSIISIAVVVYIFNASIAGGADLLLTIRTADSNDLLPSRVQVRDSGGKDHIPEGALRVKVGMKGWWFVSKGQTRMKIPADQVEIRVEHGTEYRPFKKTYAR